MMVVEILVGIVIIDCLNLRGENSFIFKYGLSLLKQ